MPRMPRTARRRRDCNFTLTFFFSCAGTRSDNLACAHDLKFRIALVRQTAVAPPPRTTPPTTKATRATTSRDDG